MIVKGDPRATILLQRILPKTHVVSVVYVVPYTSRKHIDAP
jgi:hypothetical protein